MTSKQESEKPDPSQSVPPPDQATPSDWIMNAINRLDERVTENARIQDERLRAVENAISSFKGWLGAFGVGLVILQIIAFFAYRFLDISLK